ncbi:MAG: hypothetical protein KJP18_16850 [Gemmatimonadetes bacterium]|nr:hypothetical protein [Gemmatimonadota bacterium]
MSPPLATPEGDRSTVDRHDGTPAAFRYRWLQSRRSGRIAYMSFGVRIEFDVHPPVFRTGEIVSGHVVVDQEAADAARSVTIRHRWRTEGKGTNEKSRPSAARIHEGALPGSGVRRVPFAFGAPSGPFTYRGHHLGIEHSLEAVVEIPWGPDVHGEQPFVLSPGRVVRPPDELLELETSERVEATRRPPLVLIGAVSLFFGLMTLPFPGFLFMGAAVALFVFAFGREVAQRRTGAVEMIVDPEVVKPGDAIDVVVSLRPPSHVVVNGIKATFQARELCTSGSGNQKKVHKHLGYHEVAELTGAAHLAGKQEHVFEGRFRVPAIGMWSFRGKKNRITWDVEVEVDIPSWPDWKRRVEVLVWPTEDHAIRGVPRTEALPGAIDGVTEAEDTAPTFDVAEVEEPPIEEPAVAEARVDEAWVDEAEVEEAQATEFAVEEAQVDEVVVRASEVEGALGSWSPEPETSGEPAMSAPEVAADPDPVASDSEFVPGGIGASEVGETVASGPETDELARAVQAALDAGVVAGDRQSRIEDLIGRPVDRAALTVNRVIRPYGRMLRRIDTEGRIVRGRLTGTRHDVEVLVPAAPEDVRTLRYGDRVAVSGEVVGWERLPDRPVLRGRITAIPAGVRSL